METLFKLLININSMNAMRKTNFLQATISSQIGLSRKNFSKKRSIRTALGIPEPPKRPKNAFMKFVDTVKSTNKKPNGDQRAIVKLAGQKWRALGEDEKKPYYEGYAEALDLYKKELTEYNSRVDESQRDAVDKQLREKKLKQVARIEKRNFLNMLHELGKPKQPTHGYSLFMAEHKGESFSTILAKWSALSKSEKETYYNMAADQRKQYKKQLIKWEAEMTAQGRGHLVRKNFFDAVKTSKKSSKVEE